MKMLSIQTFAATLTASLLLPAGAQDFILHEWGTFTTVIGSDGTHLDGVHREDAPLPGFVYQLDAPPKPTVRRRMTKGLDYSRTFAHVNVRLETPVIYFYTNRSFDAQVDVGFKGGTIGQWFPDRSAGEKRQRQRLLDFANPREGSIRWNVHVEPAGADQSARVFRAGELPCWLYPRYPDSALVTNSKDETEKYLFYRGLGRLELPVVFTASDQELHAATTGKEAIAQWLVFDLNNERQARWSLPASITPETGKVSVPLQSQPYRPNWRKALYADGLKMLMSAGLYRKEADAMLQTWWTSYFETPGLRVFWIVPRTMVDEVLPLEVSPKPKTVERVIVGRSEILRPSFENRLLADFTHAFTYQRPNRWAADRFFPAYSARVNQLTPRLASATAPQPKANWNDRISSARLGANVRILAFENADFKGAAILLNGSAAGKGTDGNYPFFLTLSNGLRLPATWNDRISSLKIVDGRGKDAKAAKGGASDASNEAVLFENSNYGGTPLKLSIGAEIRNLTSMSPDDRSDSDPAPTLVETAVVQEIGATGSAPNR